MPPNVNVLRDAVVANLQEKAPAIAAFLRGAVWTVTETRCEIRSNGKNRVIN